MAKTNTKKKRKLTSSQPKVQPPSETSAQLRAIFWGVLGLFLLIALAGETISQLGLVSSPTRPAGELGRSIIRNLYHLLGHCSAATVALSFFLAYSELHIGKTTNARFLRRIIIFTCCILSIAIFSSTIFSPTAGGLIGTKVSAYLVPKIGTAGTLLVTSSLLLIMLGILTGSGVFGAFSAVGGASKKVAAGGKKQSAVLAGSISKGVGIVGKSIAENIKEAREYRDLEDDDPEDRKPPVFKPPKVKPIRPSKKEDETKTVVEASPPPKPKQPPKILIGTSSKPKKQTQLSFKGPKRSTYKLPSLDLLVSPAKSEKITPERDELMQNCRLLEKTLSDFKVSGQIVEVQPGPIITLYQFEPAAGVKVQKIITLADDLALSLKVPSVRVYAPVPGKGTVGIEVPNAHREVVRIRELVESPDFNLETKQLPMALGKDTFGDPFIADLTKMPHLLIAGATGTGKSVCINALLISLLYGQSPEDLNLILIDPKMLELSIYEGIPHLKSPVITEPKRAKGVLWWAVQEMERRYALMKDLGVRSLASYNSLAAGNKNDEPDFVELDEAQVVTETDASGVPSAIISAEEIQPVGPKKRLEPLPRIVIVVDELADLMLTVGKDIEELLTRLAQKARAAGIHLILATQRPSVNVITGLIKANFPTRISFQVASKIDARTILDTSGSEKLLGRGDLLYLSPGVGRLLRLHGSFLSDQEVNDVVAEIKSQGGPRYDDQIQQIIDTIENSAGGAGGDAMEEEYDALYDQAVAFVIEKGQASTSMVQRAFRIGYNRAARIIDTMEREGLVGPSDGAKPREVIGGQRE